MAKNVNKVISKYIPLLVLLLTSLNDDLTGHYTSRGVTLAILYTIHHDVSTMPSISIGVLTFQGVGARSKTTLVAVLLIIAIALIT